MKRIPYATISFLIYLFLVFLLSEVVFGGTTGKIQGIITDTNSKEPLPGVNVVIEGTILGAATNESGFYFIINIPPGTYSIKASMVGYSTENKSDVRIYVDRTTTADFNLKVSAVVGEEVTVTAKREPVPLDVSATEAYMTGEDIVESPVGRFDELMGLQAGVEFSHNQTTGGGFEVRGGDIYETDVQVDGMSIMNQMSQRPQTAISRNLIQDVQILTGGFNAEYGNVRSGLINIITKDGSYNRYSGVLEGRISPTAQKHYGPSPYGNEAPHIQAYLGKDPRAWTDDNYINPDALSGWTTEKVYEHDNFIIAAEKVDENGNYYYDRAAGETYLKEHPYFRAWEGWESYSENASPQRTAASSIEIYRWIHRPHDYADAPDQMTDIGLGGPIPFIKNTKFYVSNYYNKSYMVFPVAGRKYSHEVNTNAKITHRIKSNMNVVAQFMYGWSIGAGSADMNMRLDQGDLSAGGASVAASLNTGDNKSSVQNMFGTGAVYREPRHTPVQNQNYFGSIKFTHTYSAKTYYSFKVGISSGDFDRYYMRKRNLDKTKFIYDQLWYDAEIDNGYGRGVIGLDEEPMGYHKPRSNEGFDSYDQTGVFRIGDEGGRGNSDNFYTQVDIDGSIVSQVNQYNQIKSGFVYSRYHFSKGNMLVHDTHVPYLPIEERPYSYDKYKADPSEFSWYVQDKLEWEGMIINFGLRGITYFPGVKGYNFTKDNMFTSMWDGLEQFGTVEGEGNWNFQNSKTRELKAKVLLQPRLGISHPITESSKIFFNYGHFYSKPNVDQMFLVRQTTLIGTLFGNGTLPQPDLRWPKVISYEIGYSQSLYDQFLLQISGYYKDYSDNLSTLTTMNYWNNVEILTWQNSGYRDVRGLEFRVERNFGRYINFWANYNYMITSSGKTGFSDLYENQLLTDEQWYSAGQSKPETRPSFRFNINLRTPGGFGPGPRILGVKPLEEWRFNFLMSWRDGGKFVEDESIPTTEWNYIQRVNYKMIDIYLTKRIARGANFYIQVKNVFDFKTLRSIDPYYRSSMRYPWSPKPGNDKYGEYDKYYLPTHIEFPWMLFSANKRDIYMGIRYQF